MKTLAAIFHSVRRWFWSEFGPDPEEGQCIDCGKELTQDEAFHYLVCCERCEALALPEDR